LSADDPKPAFVYDGQGRYAYERRLAFGLLERVVCDGTHLWHMYPELGIGAKRTVNRFHRSALADLVPGFVLPADDYAYGADVKAVDARTVALVPIMPTMAEEVAAWVEEHLIFDGPRLAERQWVVKSNTPRDWPDGGLLFREVYEGGTTRLLTIKGNELDKSQCVLRPTEAPELKPDLSGLVVLPLPLRSRDHVYRELDMEP